MILKIKLFILRNFFILLLSETYHIGVEMGGTGCKIAFMSSADPEKLIDVHLVPTEKPMKTLENLASFILKQPHTFSSMGIASFGPSKSHTF